MPPTPIQCGADWPLMRVMKAISEGGLNMSRGVQEEDEQITDGNWGEGLDIGEVDGMQNGDVGEVEDDEMNEENEEGGWECEDIELPPELDTPKVAVNACAAVFVTPPPGMPVSQIWIQKSSLAGELAAAGNFDTAMRLLNRQLGIKNFAPLRPLFLDLHTGSHSYVPAFSSPIISLAVERGWSETASPNARGPPALVFNLSQFVVKLKAGYEAISSEKYMDGLQIFRGILHTIPLIVVESRREVDEVRKLIFIAKEYVLGLHMELKIKENKNNPVRQQELAAYFTHCKLQMPHLRQALMIAMTVSYKAKNFYTAASFARRVLETNPTHENQAERAREVLQNVQKKLRDVTPLNYHFRLPFVVCGATHVPIYGVGKDVACPYCGSRFVPSQEGKLCSVCDLAVVGSDASGLLCSSSQVRCH